MYHQLFTWFFKVSFRSKQVSCHVGPVAVAAARAGDGVAAHGDEFFGVHVRLYPVKGWTGVAAVHEAG